MKFVSPRSGHASAQRESPDQDQRTGKCLCEKLSCLLNSNNKKYEKVPAQAITTSSLPAIVVIVLTAASFSALSHNVSLTMWTLPGYCWTRACRPAAAGGFLAPAKTITFSRRARAVTRPKPAKLGSLETLEIASVYMYLCLWFHQKRDTQWRA
jgi:hypothetical protein